MEFDKAKIHENFFLTMFVLTRTRELEKLAGSCNPKVDCTLHNLQYV